MRTGVGFILLLLSVGSCDTVEPRVCPGSVNPALVVEITDAETGLPIAAGANGVARDGEYVDSLSPHQFDAAGVMIARQAALGRPGTYLVAVTHPGYELWVDGPFSVRMGECTVETRTLQAALESIE
jgi:hypothetical protein